MEVIVIYMYKMMAKYVKIMIKAYNTYASKIVPYARHLTCTHTTGNSALLSQSSNASQTEESFCREREDGVRSKKG